jgi:hypothetical protein
MKMTKEKTRIIATRAKMKHSGEKTIQGTRQTEANILLGASLELSSLGYRGSRSGEGGKAGEMGRGRAKVCPQNSGGKKYPSCISLRAKEHQRFGVVEAVRARRRTGLRKNEKQVVTGVWGKTSFH